MYNWSTDESKFDTNSERYLIWRLEQMINFGLGKEKLETSQLRKYWEKISIDSARREFLSLLLNESRNFR